MNTVTYGADYALITVYIYAYGCNSIYALQFNYAYKFNSQHFPMMYGISGTEDKLSSTYSISDCSLFSSVRPLTTLSQPPSNLVAGDSTTLTCKVSSVTRYTTFMWTVDNITYNTSGTFNTSRGQIVLSYSTFDSAVTCSKSSNLTILNVSMDSEGVYSCSAIQNNYITDHNMSLVMSSNVQTSSSGEFLFLSEGVLYILVVLCFRTSSFDRSRNYSRDCNSPTSFGVS